MKLINIKIILLLLSFSLFTIGCEDDQLIPDTEYIEKVEVGYLALSSLKIIADVDEGEIIQTKSTISAEELNNYIIVIKNSDNETLKESTYGQIITEGDLPLEQGSYTIEVRSPGDMPETGYDVPFYGTQRSFSIIKGQTETIADLTCSLINIKTTVELSADIKELFKADNPDNPDDEENLKITVDYGNNGLKWNRVETRDGYFKPYSEENTMVLTLSGMYNIRPEGEPAEYIRIEGWKQTFDNVMQGQWRKIYIAIENANEGNVEFNISVETWTYDDNIDVDIMSKTDEKLLYLTSLKEEALDIPENYISDVNAPTASFIGGAYNEEENKFNISETLFFRGTSNTVCLAPIKATILPTENAEVTSAWVEFNTTNTDFIESLKRDGVDMGEGRYRLSVIENGVIASAFSQYAELKGNTIHISDNGMLELYKYEGEHKATLMLEDNQNRTNYIKDIIVNVDRSSAPEQQGPEIVWVGGSFDVIHNITNATEENPYPIELNITSTTGLIGLSVGILSPVLTEEELAGMNLSSNMDLINPTTEAMNTTLNNLGFPTKENVEGKTNLTINITDFTPLIKILGSGETQFVITAKQATGETTKTIKLIVD